MKPEHAHRQLTYIEALLKSEPLPVALRQELQLWAQRLRQYLRQGGRLVFNVQVPAPGAETEPAESGEERE